MYIENATQRRQMAAQQQTLDGFNPLKAIGRALGATGRALVSAIPVVGAAASSVLDTASHQPAAAGANPAQAATSAIVNTQAAQAAANMTDAQKAANATGLPVAVAPTAMETLLLNLVGKSSAAAPAASGPVITMTPGGSPQYGQPQYLPAPSAMPSWLIPAAIGGAALLFVMSQRGKK